MCSHTIFRPLFPALARTGVSICLLAAAALVFPGAVAAAKKVEIQTQQSGALPQKGRFVLRSGMQWLNETAPMFYKVSSELAKELTELGLTRVTVGASALDPMPNTPLPNKSKAQTSRPPTPAPDKGPAEEEASQKAADLGKSGKLPKLKLRTYQTPDKDTDLPESVRLVASPDVTRALYAKSQQTGTPVVQNFAIPGRIPKELADDAKVADYAFVIRFAAVRSWASAPEQTPFAGPPGVLVAASTVGGTSRLGFGTPAQPSPPGRDTYGTPGGYVRGYEGSSAGDFWHRDNDFYQRDYQFKHGPQPNYATPPSGLSPHSGGTGRGFGVAPLPGGEHGVSNVGWHFLLVDCFDLAPAREGKKPAIVWQAAVRAPGADEDLGTALPKMARAAVAVQPNQGR